MRFLDYIFYRSYQYERNKEKSGHKASLFVASGSVGLFLMMMTMWLWAFFMDWINLREIQCQYKEQIVIILWVSAFQFIPLLYYRNKVELLNEKFKKSPWNKRLSDTFIRFILASSIFIGVALMVITQSMMSDHATFLGKPIQ